MSPLSNIRSKALRQVGLTTVRVHTFFQFTQLFEQGVVLLLIGEKVIQQLFVYRCPRLLFQVFSNLDKFKELHPALNNLTVESMLLGLSAPLHPGAEKYFKEAGLR